MRRTVVRGLMASMVFALGACGASTPPEPQPTFTAEQLNALAARPGEGPSASEAEPAPRATAPTSGGATPTESMADAGAVEAASEPAPAAVIDAGSAHHAATHAGDAGTHHAARHDGGAAH